MYNEDKNCTNCKYENYSWKECYGLDCYANSKWEPKERINEFAENKELRELNKQKKEINKQIKNKIKELTKPDIENIFDVLTKAKIDFFNKNRYTNNTNLRPDIYAELCRMYEEIHHIFDLYDAIILCLKEEINLSKRSCTTCRHNSRYNNFKSCVDMVGNCSEDYSKWEPLDTA